MIDAPTEREASGTWGMLRRRKVVQWTLAYAAAAWTLLQVVEYFAETYAWPPAVRQIAALALPLGALFVLVVAWYHGDRGEQKVSRPEVAILVMLVIGFGVALWSYVSRLDESAWEPAHGLPDIKHVVPKDAASVAVLPFVNMSSDPEQEYFADGLSEELLNSLARVPGLYVPARTSSFQFKGRAGDVAKFAALLGVAHVLEGSVRKAEGRVRITVQLIKADDGYHVWSQTYDRELKDVFAIQSEISSAITEALKVRLSVSQKAAASQSPPTSNMNAYEEYLLGRFEFNKRRPETVAAAISHYEKAIALDPQFADAYADLAIALRMTGKKYLPTSEEETRSREALSTAVSLAPERPAVLAATAFRAWGDARLADNTRDDNGDLKPEARVQVEGALEKLERALAADPSNADVVRWREGALNLLGRPGDSFTASAEALRIDPLSVTALSSRIFGLARRGRRAEAQLLVDRLMSIDPPSAHVVLSDVAFAIDGDSVEGFRQSLLYYDLVDVVNRNVAQGLFEPLAFLGHPEEARNALAATMGATDLVGQAFILWATGDFRGSAEVVKRVVSADQWAYYCALGHLLYLLSDFEGSHRAMSICWEKGAPGLGLGGARLLIAADVARRLGDDDKAQRYIRWFEKELRHAETEGIVVDHYLLAMYESYMGRKDVAARELVAGVQENVWLEAPHMALLREFTNRPDYLAAVEAQRAELDRQAARVIKMLCGPEPVSRKYKPLPETCAQWKPSK